MPDKLQTYVQLAGQTAAGLTRNLESWTGFLSTASRLYKYPFPDQLLIHAQNPKSTAVAGFDIWTKKMRRYVRRGSKGIAPYAPTLEKLTKLLSGNFTFFNKSIFRQF